MLSLKASDVYDVAKPLHFYSQLLGVTAFSLRSVDGVFTAACSGLNVLFIVLSTFWSFSFGVIFLLSLGDLWIVEKASLTGIFEKSIAFIFVGFSICSVLTNWWLFFAKKHFASIFTLMFKVDKDLERLKAPVNLKKQKLFIFSFIVFSQLLAFFDVCLIELISDYNKLYKVNLWLIMTIWICLQLTIVSIFQFVFIMWMVKLRYEKINFLMEKELLIETANPRGYEKLTSLAKLHDSLVDVSENINRCYGLPVSKITSSNECLELTFTNR